MKQINFLIVVLSLASLIGCGGSGASANPYAGNYKSGTVDLIQSAVVRPMGGGPTLDLGSTTVQQDGKFGLTLNANLGSMGASNLPGGMSGTITPDGHINATITLLDNKGTFTVSGSGLTVTPPSRGGGPCLYGTVNVDFTAPDGGVTHFDKSDFILWI